MKKVLDEDTKASPAPAKAGMEHEDNRAWALEWDGAALAELRRKKGDPEKWDRL